MRYIHIIALLVTPLATLIACSLDAEEAAHQERTHGISRSEPRPDWADNIVTITVGRFDTKEKLVSEFLRQEEKGMMVLGEMEHWLTTREHLRGIAWEEFRITPPKQAYTIDITLISMQDAGFKKPTMIAKVRDRIMAMGFRPITFEEAYEIRLQLKDQPNWWETKHPWSHFRSLPAKEEMRRMYGGKEVSVGIFSLGEKYGIVEYIYQLPGPGIRNDKLLIPSEEFREQGPIGEEINPSFACAILGSKRRK